MELTDMGIGLAVHAIDLDSTLTARIDVADQPIEAASGNLDALAPLPNGLFYLSWKFAPKWMLAGRLGYFTLDYRDYSGSMTNAHVLLNYGLSSRWSLGMGYQFGRLDLDVDETDYVQA